MYGQRTKGELICARAKQLSRERDWVSREVGWEPATDPLEHPWRDIRFEQLSCWVDRQDKSSGIKADKLVMKWVYYNNNNSKIMAPKKKGGKGKDAGPVEPASVEKCVIFLAKEYPEFQKKCL